ncbi:MAG: AsmA-like C-terminal region-containing protein [Hyphomicrobiaceae bacterium]
MAANKRNRNDAYTGGADRSVAPTVAWRWLRRVRGIAVGFGLVLAPVFLLVAIGIGVLYVRLANGPVSLSYLKPAIERQIAQKLGGLKVDVSDVVLSLAGDGGAFRLTDVRVRDHTDVVVAQAPLASMQIDRTALLRGVVIPTGIVLIRPRMRLAYSDTNGLSLSFSRNPKRTDDGPQSAAATDRASSDSERQQPSPRDGEVGSLDGAASITVLRTIARLLSEMRTGPASGRSLDTIGVRNALIELDYGGRRSRWGVPSGDIHIKHLADRSVVSGLATLAESEGQNIVFALNAESLASTRAVELRTSVRDLRPSTLARIVPAFAGLTRVNAGLSAEAKFNLRDTGDVIDGSVTMEFGRGTIDMADGIAPVQLDHGRVALQFDEKSPAITVRPSTLSWGGGNEIVVIGAFAPTRVSRSTEDGWAFDLFSKRGHLVSHAGAGVRQPIERWSAAGSVDPGKGHLQIDKAILAVAGGSVLVNGSVTGARVAIEGRIGPAPMNALAYLWPAATAPTAHVWVRNNILGGRLAGGRFTVTSSGQTHVRNLVLRGRDVQLKPVIGDRPIFAEKVLVELSGDRLTVNAPGAMMPLPNNRSLGLRQIRFNAPLHSKVRSVGNLQFKLRGKLRDGMTALSNLPRRAGIPADVYAVLEKKASGSLDGQLNVVVPLDDAAAAREVVTGQVQIKDLRVTDIIGRHDIAGGVIDLNLAAKSLNADGEMLIAGVATKLAWQYILDAPLESQPPVRLVTSLDEGDRQKLGIKVNHILSGIVDVDISLIPRTGGGFGSKVRANLTRAAIAIDSLAWLKPKGRLTQLEFDVVPGKKHPFELSNLRVVGDGIAIQGRAMLNAAYGLQAFDLPLFSIDRVTRLNMRGKLQRNNVWQVVVRGQTFEGRSLFRSLFDTGRAARLPKVPRAQQMGVDLEAEITTVLGFWNSRLSNVRISISKRKGEIQKLQLEGRLAGNALLKAAVIPGKQKRRELHAFSEDAGRAFRLVGFYPNVQQGRLELVVDLDGRGAADKSGVLLVKNFRILGDEVVGELARAPSGGIRPRRAAQSDSAQALVFDWMRLPFFVGNGQFILQGAELRGPVVGATIEGKADFAARRIDLSGTYVPLQGLNGALGVIPGLGQILAGPNGEGVLGMKFAVRGPMNQPEMLVNPLSLMAPGIFREIFQISNPSLEVTKRGRPTQAPAQRPSGSGGKPRSDWQRDVFGEHK